MNTLYDEMKDQFRKRDNAVVKLIFVNVIIYLIDLILQVISAITKTDFYQTVQIWQSLPSDIQDFLYKPWTLISYFFVHETPLPFHIFFNMIGLYMFGKIIQDMLGSRRVMSLFILGGLLGGLFYLLLFNTVPYFVAQNPRYLVGASASVFAIAVAAATLVPHFSINLFLFGRIRIIYIVGFYIVISVAGSIGKENSGGNLAHLGGALLGYFFIILLKKGIDLGRPISRLFDLFNGRGHLKVSFRRKGVDENYAPNEAEIDNILDKINRSGYESLTKDEKMKLFKASQK